MMSLRVLITAFVLVLLAPAQAMAIPQCPTEDHRLELSGFEEQLLQADDVNEARELALTRVDRTRRAIDRAALIVPGDAELRAHQADLEAFAHDIEVATTKQEVAAGFAQLRVQQVGTKCHYSTGEIVAIVIGFILGIIPGIILLILFC